MNFEMTVDSLEKRNAANTTVRLIDREWQWKWKQFEWRGTFRARHKAIKKSPDPYLKIAAKGVCNALIKGRKATILQNIAKSSSGVLIKI